jgi:4-amino-4-deoxy-L-arabinose transferase-like glycosyltransferase
MENIGRHRQHRRFTTRTVLLFVLVLSAILLIPTLFWNFTYDQGTFAYGGTAILHGERPYVDFWDIKPPNIFYTYAAAFALLGQSVFAIRLFSFLNALVVIALTFLLSTRLWRNTPWRHLSGVMAALAIVLQFYIMGDWNTAQVEDYSLAWLLAAVLLVVPHKSHELSRRLLLRASLSGLLIAVATFYKFPNGLFLLLAAGALWLYCRPEEHKRGISALVAGFAAGVALHVIFLAMNGALGTLWHITTTATATYVANNYSGGFGVVQNLRTGFQTMDLLWVIVGIIGWSLWGLDHHPRAKHTPNVFVAAMLLLLAMFLGLLIVQFQNKGYTYHYWIVMPWADLLIGAGIGHVARVLHQLDTLPRGNNAAAVAIMLFVLSYVWTSANPLKDRVAEFGQVLRGERPANGYIANDTLANYVERHSRPDDRIFIFGFEPYVYWKTGRHPATRFLNTIHFKPSGVPLRERTELIDSLTANPPQLFLVETSDKYTSQGNSNDDSRTTIRNRYPEIEQLLQTRYTAHDTIQSTIAYVLRPDVKTP